MLGGVLTVMNVFVVVSLAEFTGEHTNFSFFAMTLIAILFIHMADHFIKDEVNTYALYRLVSYAYGTAFLTTIQI